MNASTPTNTQSSIDFEEPKPGGEDYAYVSRYPSNPRPYQTQRPAFKKKNPQNEIGNQLINVMKESAEYRRKRDKLFLCPQYKTTRASPHHKETARKKPKFVNN